VGRRLGLALLLAAALALGCAATAGAALRWQDEPKTVSEAGSFDQRILIDARGDALVVWRTLDGTVVYRWHEAGGGWGDARSMGDNVGGFDAAMSPLGVATVVWYEPGRVVAVTGEHGAKLGDRDVVKTPGRMANFVPHVALDDAGDTVVAWPDYDPTGKTGAHTSVALRHAGGEFGDAQVVDDNSSGGPVELAMNPAGAAAVTWREGDGTGWASYREPAAGRFGAPERVKIDELSPLLVALAEDGTAYVAGTKGSPVWGQTGDALLSRRPPLGAWTDPLPIAVGSASEQLLVEPSGAASLVGWRSGAHGLGTTTFTTVTPGGGISGPTDISGPDTVAPRVATTLGGSMLAAWFDEGEGGGAVATSDRPAGGAFSAPQDRTPPDAKAPVDVALTEGGQAGIAWPTGEVGKELRDFKVHVLLREDPDVTERGFPPSVSIGAPKRRALTSNGSITVPVRCSRGCMVHAGGVLYVNGRAAKVVKRSRHGRRLVAHRRGRVTLRFGSDAGGAGKKAVTVSVTARGRSLRRVTFSRRIRLR
jgi:hypothetical protein